jgi:tripartite-type tricarboxylate transporter receptor subunit TctC
MIKKKVLVIVLMFVLVVLLIAACGNNSGPAENGAENTAQAEENFYQGKELHIIVPHGAGGGYDTYARLVQPYLAKNLGATVVIDNVPGAGGNVGRNQVWASPPDGLTIGFTSGTAMVYSQLTKTEGVQYNADEMTWLPRLYDEPSVLVVPANGRYQTIQEVMAAIEPVKVAVSGVGDDDFFAMAVETKALGLNVLPVTGYDGTKEGSLAVVRGEVDLFQTSVSTMLPMIKSGDVKPIMVVYDTEIPELPGVPTAASLAQGEGVEMIQTAINLIKVARVYFAPPGFPEDRAKDIEIALEKSLQDPELVQKMQDAEKPVHYLGGGEVKKLIDESLLEGTKVAPAVQEFLQKSL